MNITREGHYLNASLPVMMYNWAQLIVVAYHRGHPIEYASVMLSEYHANASNPSHTSNANIADGSTMMIALQRTIPAYPLQQP